MKENKFDIQDRQYIFPYHYTSLSNPYRIYVPHAYGALYREAILKKVLNHLIKYYNNHKKPLRILDFGCGDGRLISEIMNLYAQGKIEVEKVFGIDLSERAILFAKAFMYDFKDKVEFYIKDIRKLRLNMKFDLIFAIEVLEHIPDKDIEGVVKSLHALLDERGRFIVSVPSQILKQPKKHYRHYTMESIEKQLSKYFKKVECEQHINITWYEIYKRILSNRFCILNFMPLLKLLDSILGRKLERESQKGINIFCVFKKREEKYYK